MKLGDICEVITKGTTPTSLGLKFSDAGVNFIKIESISESGNFLKEKFAYISKECHNKLSRSQLKEGDLLFSIAGVIGRTAIVTKDILPANTNQAIAIIRLKEEYKGLRELIYLYFNSPLIKIQYSKKKQGVAQLNLSLQDIKDFEILEIKKEKKDEIIRNLRLIKELILKRKQQLISIYNLAKSRFIEMFGDVIRNDKNWKVKKWKDVLEIKNGKSQKDVIDEKGKYPIYGSGGIIGYASNYITKANSIVIGRKGSINKPFIVKENFWNVDTAFGIEPDNRNINLHYLFLFCNFFDFKRLNKAAVLPSLVKSDLLNIQMPIPPFSIQEDFSIFIEQLDKSKFRMKKCLKMMSFIRHL